jgi:hypothetical protein
VLTKLETRAKELAILLVSGALGNHGGGGGGGQHRREGYAPCAPPCTVTADSTRHVTRPLLRLLRAAIASDGRRRAPSCTTAPARAPCRGAAVARATAASAPPPLSRRCDPAHQGASKRSAAARRSPSCFAAAIRADLIDG